MDGCVPTFFHNTLSHNRIFVAACIFLNCTHILSRSTDKVRCEPRPLKALLRHSDV